ncbi:MAG: 1,2-phenylacetyl-CoA epoxidase subunit B [Bacteroidia bacterium]
MKIKSLDPRVSRMELDAEAEHPQAVLGREDHWETYQVFHQRKRGDKHVCVGIVHAPSAELAMMFAKEQYARRGETVNLWIVNTRDVLAMDYDDYDVFSTTPEKIYRDPAGYKVNEKIAAYKKANIDV